jgi:hypothetical protein
LRGLATLFWGRNIPDGELSKILVVCSSDDLNFLKILASVQNHFTKGHFTYIIPDQWRRFLPDGAESVSVSDIKSSPVTNLFKLRSRKYDATVLMLTGRPVFKKVKLWSILTNYRCLMIWNENLDYFPCCAENRHISLMHIKWRLAEKGIISPKSHLLNIILSPLGFLYLLYYRIRHSLFVRR